MYQHPIESFVAHYQQELLIYGGYPITRHLQSSDCGTWKVLYQIKHPSSDWESLGEISFELNQEKIGKTFKTLIDKKEAGRYLGRTEFDSVEVDNEVVIHSSKKLPIGEFVNVEITKAFDYDLEGEVIS